MSCDAFSAFGIELIDVGKTTPQDYHVWVEDVDDTRQGFAKTLKEIVYGLYGDSIFLISPFDDLGRSECRISTQTLVVRHEARTRKKSLNTTSFSTVTWWAVFFETVVAPFSRDMLQS